MPGKRNQRQPKHGAAAIKSMAKNSKDQAPMGARRTKNNHLLNGYGIDGKAVMRDIKMLKSLLNVEEKHIDTIGSTTVASNASAIIPIGTVAQGSNSTQRTGDSIKLIRHDFNLLFNYSTGTPATTAQEFNIFNWYYVKYNKTPSSSGATAFSISEFLNLDNNSNYSPLSLVNPDTNENFTILDSGQVKVGPNMIGTASINAFQLVESSVNRMYHQTYNGTAASNVCDNMTFLVFTCSQNANAGGSSSVTYGVRQWFIDN